jgi:Uma2 family endonuclease
METTFEIDEEISDYEQERGKPMPSYKHSIIQGEIFLEFARYRPEFRAFSELSLELGNFRPVPDICVFPERPVDWGKDILCVTEPPLLTIEILSPKQSLGDLFEKADEYLRHGVEESWVIIPEIQSISVCTIIGKQKTYTSGDVRHNSTGIILNIEKLFA